MLRYLLLIIPLLWGCAGSKKQMERELAQQPAWVKQQPVNPDYFIGVGMSSKNEYNRSFVNAARKQALSQIAGQISTQISSTSLLQSIETDQFFKQDFQSLIKTRSEQELEGYEQVGVYENKEQYWVYFRLDKRAHEARQRQKMESTLAKAKDLYFIAKKQEEAGDYNSALKNYFEAILVVKPYWAQDLETELFGQKVFFGNYLSQEIQSCLRDLSIDSERSELQVLNGNPIASDELRFRVLSKHEHAVASLPIKFVSSQGYLAQSEAQSDAQGWVGYSFDPFRSNSSKVSFNAIIDYSRLKPANVYEPLLDKIIKAMPPVGKKVDILVSQPQVYIDFSDPNIDAGVQNGMEQSVKKVFNRKDVLVTDAIAQADYVLTVSTDLQHQKVGSANDWDQCKLELNYEIYHNKQLRWQRQSSAYTSKARSLKVAKSNAFNEAQTDLQYKLAEEFYRLIYGR